MGTVGRFRDFWLVTGRAGGVFADLGLKDSGLRMGLCLIEILILEILRDLMMLR